VTVARRGVGASAALTSVATAATMLTGGVFALLIAGRFGSTAETDGFFAAYGAYTIAVLVAQSMRTTIVARLVEAPSRFAGFDAFLAAVGVLFVGVGIVFAALGAPLARVLTGGLDQAARETARDALLVLWPAAGFQLVASLSAAMLGVLEDFVRAALAYGAGSVVSIAAFLALVGALDTDALALAVLIGSAVTALPLVEAVRRAGWRPARSAGARPAAGRPLRDALLVLIGAAPIAIVQALYLVSAAAAARSGEGAVTTYSYGYFAHALVLSLGASSIAVVLAAPVAATWDRDPRSLAPHVQAVLRAGLLVLAPVVAGAALVGQEIAGVLLPKFSDARVDAVIDVFLALAPAVVFAQALAVPLVALFAAGRHVPAALVGAVVVVVHAGLSAAIAGTEDLYQLALVSSLSSLLFSLGLAAVLYRRELPAFLAQAGREIAIVGLAAGAAYGLAYLALGWFADVAVLVAGTALLAAVIARLEGHREIAVRMLRIVQPGSSRRTAAQ
jgi:peptidoglycan biosynthesis protein MviN/MurJ (putative lipid II flippase)